VIQVKGPEWLPGTLARLARETEGNMAMRKVTKKKPVAAALVPPDVRFGQGVGSSSA
jgi:hypothetical protein